MSRFLKVIVNIFLVAAILTAVALLVPPFLGITTTIVDTEAMDTNLPMGSVTYSRDINVMDIRSGDKILKESGSSTYAYIIKEGNPSSGQFKAVNAVDPNGQTEEITLRNNVSRVMLTVPYIGYVIVAMHSIEGIIIIALVVFFMIILFVLSELWKRESDDEDDEDEDDDEDDEADTDADYDPEAGDDDDYEDEEELSRAERREKKKRAKAEAREAKRRAKEEAKAAKRAKKAGEPSIVSRVDEFEDFPVAETTAEEAAKAEEIAETAKAIESIGKEAAAEAEETVTDDTASLATALAGVGAASLTGAADLAVEMPEAVGTAEAVSEEAEPDAGLLKEIDTAVDLPNVTETAVDLPGMADTAAETAGDLFGDLDVAAAAAAQETVGEAVEKHAENAGAAAEQVKAEMPAVNKDTRELITEELVEAMAAAEREAEEARLARTFVPVQRPTLDELIEEAEKHGENPKLIKDTTTGITLVDYTEIL